MKHPLRVPTKPSWFLGSVLYKMHGGWDRCAMAAMVSQRSHDKAPMMEEDEFPNRMTLGDF